MCNFKLWKSYLYVYWQWTFHLSPLDLVKSKIHGLHSLQQKDCQKYKSNGFLMLYPTFSKKKRINVLPPKKWKKRPSKLPTICPQCYFSVLAWQPTRPQNRKSKPPLWNQYSFKYWCIFLIEKWFFRPFIKWIFMHFFMVLILLNFGWMICVRSCLKQI